MFFAIKTNQHFFKSNINFVNERKNSIFKTRDEARGITRSVSQSNRVLEREGELMIVHERVV